MRKPIVSIGSEYQTDDLDLENEKIIVINPTVCHQPLRWWYSFSDKIEIVCRKVRNHYEESGYDTISGRTGAS